ncbi:Nif3-like dinuclear metal center hexameric protein [Sphingobacteriales bacterium UPWRP_1]|nr:Nif3-like dinuclear metal center hexameric protein [Sphingobacteriales bacterium TSM_CSM]PSJ77022.1 Nif3-like dinuclear metal center hexameric protein [Sphingobacteriales bacterium UPWRP_1]
MKIKDIVAELESIAPLKYQEGYDNSGYIVGTPDAVFKKALICLDSTEAVLDEAIEKGCNLVIAHHPIIFGGLKKITGKNYVERVIMKAIKNDITIYAAHTNLDSVHNGVSRKICDRLGLQHCRVLAPQSGVLKKLSVLCPIPQADAVRTALWEAGAGQTADHRETSFNLLGISTFTNSNTTPAETQYGELKIETIFEAAAEGKIMQTLNTFSRSLRLYYEISPIENKYSNVGLGMIGCLPEPQDPSEFLTGLKTTMQTPCIRHTRLFRKKVQHVAVCGGAGFSLLPHAIAQRADVFVTADVKYHQFFDADKHLILADIGHYESEQFTIELLKELLSEKISNFAAVLTSVNTNPVNYL